MPPPDYVAPDPNQSPLQGAVAVADQYPGDGGAPGYEQAGPGVQQGGGLSLNDLMGKYKGEGANPFAAPATGDNPFAGPVAGYNPFKGQAEGGLDALALKEAKDDSAAPDKSYQGDSNPFAVTANADYDNNALSAPDANEGGISLNELVNKYKGAKADGAAPESYKGDANPFAVTANAGYADNAPGAPKLKQSYDGGASPAAGPKASALTGTFNTAQAATEIPYEVIKSCCEVGGCDHTAPAPASVSDLVKGSGPASALTGTFDTANAVNEIPYEVIKSCCEVGGCAHTAPSSPSVSSLASSAKASSLIGMFNTAEAVNEIPYEVIKSCCEVGGCSHTQPSTPATSDQFSITTNNTFGSDVQESYETNAVQTAAFETNIVSEGSALSEPTYTRSEPTTIDLVDNVETAYESVQADSSLKEESTTYESSTATLEVSIAGSDSPSTGTEVSTSSVTYEATLETEATQTYTSSDTPEQNFASEVHTLDTAVHAQYDQPHDVAQYNGVHDGAHMSDRPRPLDGTMENNSVDAYVSHNETTAEGTTVYAKDEEEEDTKQYRRDEHQSETEASEEEEDESDFDNSEQEEEESLEKEDDLDELLEKAVIEEVKELKEIEEHELSTSSRKTSNNTRQRRNRKSTGKSDLGDRKRVSSGRTSQESRKAAS